MSNRSLGVHYQIYGEGHPLILGFPIMATTMPEDPGGDIRKGYLDRLTDRYRVLIMDYPDQGPNMGRSARILPGDLTAQRVCDDILAVADAADFSRFAWWGYSWGGVIGLQLAARSERVSALVCGAWPPLGGAYADFLRATRALTSNPPKGFPLPTDQMVTFYESVENWPEAEAVQKIRCPRLAFAGTADVWEGGGVTVRIGATVHERRSDLERQGWHVVEIEGRDHSLYKHPSIVVPVVRKFLDQAT
jgi:pimeloyl-ACP methyl ester carboxylesterase